VRTVTAGGRVPKYRHSFTEQVPLGPARLAVLCELMLRGPQTAGELRIACERLHRFADISAVEGFLNELAARPAGALVRELARLPGARENRWAHLLSGMPAPEAPAAAAKEGATEVPPGELAALKADVARLEAEVRELRELVTRMSTG